MGNRKRKLSFKKLPVLRQLQFPTEGEYFDLQTLFDKLNAEYFSNALKGYTITWGRKRKRPPKEYFVFGTIQEEDKMIRIHPLLDAPFVPTWFLEYVLYHEMLHAVVPEEIDEHGRRRVHTREFYRRERKFHCYYRARRWEDENLDRFFARWGEAPSEPRLHASLLNAMSPSKSSFESIMNLRGGHWQRNPRRKGDNLCGD